MIYRGGNIGADLTLRGRQRAPQLGAGERRRGEALGALSRARVAAGLWTGSGSFPAPQDEFLMRARERGRAMLVACRLCLANMALLWASSPQTAHGVHQAP